MRNRPFDDPDVFGPDLAKTRMPGSLAQDLEAPGLNPVGDVLELDHVLPARPPEPLDEDVVLAAVAAIHREADVYEEMSALSRSGEKQQQFMLRKYARA